MVSFPFQSRKIVAVKKSTDFRAATQIVSFEVKPPGDRDVLIEVHYVGVNASDINFTAGIYDVKKEPPFDTGFEGVGVVIAVGPHVQRLTVGMPVAFSVYGSFAEHITVPESMAFPVPSASAEVLPLLVSALTASIALEQVGEMKQGETVLVTAAAGATGSFAVQLAKQAGCRVIGTCSSADKVAFLRQLGCDRPVDVTGEDLRAVLRAEFPKGVDVVYEGVGGEQFDTALAHLAVRGRLIIIGSVSGYQTQASWRSSSATDASSASVTLAARLLPKSASVRGFFLPHFKPLFMPHMMKLAAAVQDGSLRSVVDRTRSFVGLEAVADAVNHLYSRKNIGKVVVALPAAARTPAARL